MRQSTTTAARVPTQRDADAHGVTLDWFGVAATTAPPIRGGSPDWEPSAEDWADYFAERDRHDRELTEEDHLILHGCV